MSDKASSKRPRDTNQLARRIVSEATDDVELGSDNVASGKDSAAVSLGRRGGLKGGRVRAERLSAADRKKIAQQAAQARWKRNDG